MNKLLKDRRLILLILLVLIVVLIIVFWKTSSFGKTSVSISDTEGLPSIPEGKTAIFYASWCGHCRKSMDEFKAAIQGSNGLVIMVSEDSENNKLRQKYNIKGFPTIVNSSGTVYNGPRKAQDIIDFANGK